MTNTTVMPSFKNKIFISGIGRLVISLVVLGAIFAAFSPSFLSINNLLEIGRQSAVIGIAALGVTFAMIAGCIDISIASTIALSGVAFGIGMSMGLPSGVAILIALIFCSMFGYVNGMLVTKIGLNSMIVTIGMMSVIRGLAFILTYAFIGSGTIVIQSSFMDYIGRGFLLGIPMSFVVFMIASIIGFLVIRYTLFGSKIYAVGSNIKTAYLSGLPVNRYRRASLMISALLAAVAGILITAISGQAVPNIAEGYEIDILAAVIIGGTSFFGGKGSIQGTFLGAILLGVISNGLNILQVDAFWQMVVKGVILLMALYAQKEKKT